MKQMNWIELCINILKNEGHGKPLHVDAIAEKLSNHSELSNLSQEELKTKVSTSLAQHVKNKNSKIARNKKPGKKKGFYYLKRQITRYSPPKLPDISTNYTGKAGEYGVFSELLFYGFNASIMAVDEGVDIIASKNNKFFHLQVKTANPTETESFQVNNINPKKFKDLNKANSFYIFVLRRIMKNRIISEYIVLPSNRISEMKAKGIISDTYNCRISISNEKYFINNKEDITFYVNKFEIIS